MTPRFHPVGTLIVDDSETERELLRAQLRRLSSVRVVGVARDGAEAIAYLRGVDEFADRRVFPYPDLLLLDFKMPGCNGMQVLELMRYQAERPRVVLWSTTLHQIDVPLALHLGADMVCAKPASLQELVDIVRRLEANVFNRMPVSSLRNMPNVGRMHVS